MLEAERIEHDPSVKRYSNLDELFADLKKQDRKNMPSRRSQRSGRSIQAMQGRRKGNIRSR